MMTSIADKGQGAAAEFVGVDRAQISRWISGNNSMLSKFCRLYEFTVGEGKSNLIAIASDEAENIASSLRMLSMMMGMYRKKRPAATERQDQITMEF